MKNIAKVTLSIMLVAGFLFSCENEFIESPDEQSNLEILSLEDLKNDSRIIIYEERNKEFLQNILNIKKVKELSSKKILNEDELQQLSIAIGFDSFEEYAEYYKMQKKLLNSLENDYNILAYETEAIEIALSVNNTDLLHRTSSTCEDTCNTTAVNCIGAAGAGAVIGHIGCVSADITVIAGVICHAAVAAVQYFVQDECLNQHEACLADCL